MINKSPIKSLIKNLMKTVVTGLGLLLLSIHLYAEEIRYIRDVAHPPLRSGQSSGHRITRVLKSDLKVILLETNEESGYSKIRTHKGTEGWIESQYLIAEPTARLQLKSAFQKVNKLSTEIKPLKERILMLEREGEADRAKLSQVNSKNQRVEKDLSTLKKISSNAVSLDQNNKILIKSNEQLKNKLDLLSAENERLKGSADQEAFINGALAVGFGVLLAFIIPRIAPRKKRNSDWA